MRTDAREASYTRKDDRKKKKDSDTADRKKEEKQMIETEKGRETDNDRDRE